MISSSIGWEPVATVGALWGIAGIIALTLATRVQVPISSRGYMIVSFIPMLLFPRLVSGENVVVVVLLSLGFGAWLVGYEIGKLETKENTD